MLGTSAGHLKRHNDEKGFGKKIRKETNLESKLIICSCREMYVFCLNFGCVLFVFSRWTP